MKSFEQKLLGRLYCFCGGGDDGGNSGSEDAAIAEQEAYDSIGYDSTPDFSMDSLDDDPVTGDFGLDVDGSPPDDDNDNDDRARREAEEAARQEAQRAREQREAEEREAARLEAETAAEYARQESARQEAERQEAERLAAEIARIEAEEAARFEAEMEAEAARKEAERLAAEKAAEEERLSSPESLTDDQLDEAIATYSNANTAVASEVLSRLVEEKEIRTAEKAEEKVDGGVDDFNEGATTPVYQGPTITGETTYIDEEAISDVRGIVNDRLFGEGTSERDDVYAPEYWHYGVIESSDLPGSNVGISLGDLMDEYGIPADKITYSPTDIPIIDLGMTTEEIDAIYGGDDQPEKPTTQQQIIDFVTEKAIKTLDANGDGKVSALEALGAIAVGASGLGIFSSVNTLMNEAGLTDVNIFNEIISAIEDSIESAIPSFKQD
jgi:hypothetical protein